jgi:hypothetical protein
MTVKAKPLPDGSPLIWGKADFVWLLLITAMALALRWPYNLIELAPVEMQASSPN